MDGDARALWIRSGDGWLLCLRLPRNDPVLQSAANLLDEAMQREGVEGARPSRDDAFEEDAQALMEILAPFWPDESYGMQLSFGASSGAGVGPNKLHRTRVARLALGLSLFMESKEGHKELRALLTRYASLQPLVDKVWHAPEVSPEPKLPDTPTNEENYDFAASLLTFHCGETLIFNTPLRRAGRFQFQ